MKLIFVILDKIPMNSKMILVLTILLIIISLTNAKTVYGGHHYEMTSENASAFLHPSSDSVDFSKREIGRNCIPCKFGINPCCEPNICVKKSFWPDECMEIKQAGPKPHHFN
jgi:hypothetical protein